MPGFQMLSKDICTPVFTAALFTIAKMWKQPKYHQWMDKEEVAPRNIIQT